MKALRDIQRIAYKTSRFTGDVNALSRGPGVYAKRRVRRYATRKLFSLFR
jgi:hypothetical protein